jgi:hypothetical protein
MKDPFRIIGELIRPNLLLEVHPHRQQQAKDAALLRLLRETRAPGSSTSPP